MFLFIILTLILLILVIVTVLIFSIVGAGTLIIFGDVIVLILILGWIIYRIFFKKKK